MSVRVTVDGREVAVAETATVLDAALAAGIEIPHLCKDADQPPIGACRTCLVEVEGGRGFPASCHTPVLDDMVVRTRGAALERIRNGVLALTRAMQPAELAAPAGGVGRELGDTLDLFRLAEPLDSLAPKPRPEWTTATPSSSSTTKPASCAGAAPRPARIFSTSAPSPSPARPSRPTSPPSWIKT